MAMLAKKFLLSLCIEVPWAFLLTTIVVYGREEESEEREQPTPIVTT